jgi:hypothetical protein
MLFRKTESSKAFTITRQNSDKWRVRHEASSKEFTGRELPGKGSGYKWDRASSRNIHK